MSDRAGLPANTTRDSCKHRGRPARVALTRNCSGSQELSIDWPSWHVIAGRHAWIKRPTKTRLSQAHALRPGQPLLSLSHQFAVLRLWPAHAPRAREASSWAGRAMPGRQASSPRRLRVWAVPARPLLPRVLGAAGAQLEPGLAAWHGRLARRQAPHVAAPWQPASQVLPGRQGRAVSWRLGAPGQPGRQLATRARVRGLAQRWPAGLGLPWQPASVPGAVVCPGTGLGRSQGAQLRELTPAPGIGANVAQCACLPQAPGFRLG
jgi:hypothetical protein